MTAVGFQVRAESLFVNESRLALRSTQPSSQWVQLEYLVATVKGKLRSARAGPFVKVEGCCD
jgi:hypothetical protein